MKRKSFFYSVFVITVISCNSSSHNISKNSENKQAEYERDIFCGQNVLWQIHFGDGFKNDKIVVMNSNKDTLCISDSVSTYDNGCTLSYISLYNRNGRLILYNKHNSKLDSLENIKILYSDSLNLVFSIRNRNFSFKEDIREGKYQQISLFHHIQSKTCIVCM